MFGSEILNGKQLRQHLGISTTIYYRMIKSGMPFHQLTATSRRYFNVNEVESWLRKAGYQEKTTWTK